MRCPVEVENAILEIFYESALLIRGAGWRAEAEHCALLGDHIHNLPAILKDSKPWLLVHYWDTDRVCFISQAQEIGLNVESFIAQWEQIEPHVPHLQKVESSSPTLAKAV